MRSLPGGRKGGGGLRLRVMYFQVIYKTSEVSSLEIEKRRNQKPYVKPMDQVCQTLKLET